MTDNSGKSLNEMERETQERLTALIAKRDAEPDKRKRKELSQRVKLLRGVRDWLRTRVGYER